MQHIDHEEWRVTRAEREGDVNAAPRVPWTQSMEPPYVAPSADDDEPRPQASHQPPAPYPPTMHTTTSTAPRNPRDFGGDVRDTSPRGGRTGGVTPAPAAPPTRGKIPLPNPSDFPAGLDFLRQDPNSTDEINRLSQLRWPVTIEESDRLCAEALRQGSHLALKFWGTWLAQCNSLAVQDEQLRLHATSIDWRRPLWVREVRQEEEAERK